ncbi:MAG TPA: 3-hydroxyacyl-ACP dehydratase FabZ [Candidatus Megaira endosymbiont of Hartmannula sinica]|nr:3-hydroxyacyl-ACP dehydratase FabZ [Candidatus Megaera endosymbiont of Hartmannula sinica]
MIFSILPHRYPFLLIDRVESVDLKNKTAIGIKNVTVNEPQFIGHFPENPIMPGVLMVEAMAQLSAILVSNFMENIRNKEVFFLTIDECKFRKVVKPGDTLIIESQILQNRGAVWKFKAKAFVEGCVVSESKFTAMVKDKD